MPVTFANGRLAAGVGGSRTIQAGSPDQPDVVELAGGGFIAVWTIGNAARAQLFDRNGEPIGTSILLFQTPSGIGPSTVSVAGLSDGGFIATWDDLDASAGDDSGYGVKARIFDSLGEPTGDAFQVNATISGSQQQPTIAVLANGSFVIAWTDQEGDSHGSSVQAQLFDAAGTPIGGEFPVNTSESGNQYYPRAEALAGGGFVVSWIDSGRFAFQVYDDAAQKIGGEIPIDGDSSTGHAMQSLPSGGFIVVYPLGTDLLGRIFSATGAAVGDAFQINSDTAGTQYIPSIAVQPSGEFLVTWRDATLNTNFFEDGDIKAQLFDATGAKIGDEFLATPSADGGQGYTRAVAFGSGDFGVLWTDYLGSANGTLLFRALFSTTYGTAGDDAMSATLDPAYYFGLDGNDHLSGGTAIDSLDGGAGDDFISAYEGDAVEGGTGTDTLYLSLFNAAAGVSADLRQLENNGTMTIAGATITGIEFVAGISATQFDDVIVAGAIPDGPQGIDISGWAGNDELTGTAGVDRIWGGDGNDVIRGGGGTDPAIFPSGDRLRGEAGDDSIYIGSDGAEAMGGIGSDQIFGGDGGDDIHGDQGDDTLYGGGGADSLHGQDGNDLISGGAGGDALRGWEGSDRFVYHLVGDSVSGAVDVITEFESGIDKIDLSAIPVTSIAWTSAYRFPYLEHDVTIETASGSMKLLVRGTLATSDFVLAMNVMTGTEGDDVLQGTDGVDFVEGLGGNDQIDGGAGDDSIEGGDGNDTLDGGDGLDTLTGGAGDDSYTVTFGDEIVESAGGGIDTVYAAGDYFFDEGVDNIVITGAAEANSIGNALDNVMIGNSARNILEGLQGADRMEGGLGDDSYFVESAGDIVVEIANGGLDRVNSTISYTLGAHVENLKLNGVEAINGTGNALGNLIVGNGEANILDGRGGADRLEGLSGNDTYVVDHSGDVVIEHDGGGVDTVHSSVAFALGGNVENLVLTGTAAINGTGNALANSLIGNGAANKLDGGLGRDVMQGGAGNDIYVVDDELDQAVETTGNGKDLVRSSVSYTLGAHVEKLALTGTGAINGQGNGLNNYLVGNAAANVLSGGLGADALAGGAGDDTYEVDNVGDRVTENANEGTDTVLSSVSFSLTGNVENLILMGTAAINATGNSLANGLSGNSAANVLNGGGGADGMTGGGGDDIYIVDNILDHVFEAAGGGTDLIKSTVSLDLYDQVEKLTLLGSAEIGFGNALANTIVGNAVDNVLDGRAGADKMIGAGGDDLYFVDHAADQVIETSSGGGIDSVRSTISFTLGDHVENLILEGAAALGGTGNALTNILTGNAGANLLDGGRGDDALLGNGGDDILKGGLGDDILEGGAGADDFVFDKALAASNVDEILDFAAGSDDIVLENAVFKGLAAGALGANALAIGSVAADADDRIVYDPTTGNLYYDADGSGATAQILFATLDNRPASLAASDFAVI